MSESEISKHDQILAGLVMSLQAASMQHLGKIQNPMTGKVERDLEQARGSIDLLEMLKVKCRTDTPPEIVQMMDTAVMELQMNFMDEMKKGDSAESEDDSAPQDETTEDEQAEEAAEGEEAQ